MTEQANQWPQHGRYSMMVWVPSVVHHKHMEQFQATLSMVLFRNMAPMAHNPSQTHATLRTVCNSQCRHPLHQDRHCLLVGSQPKIPQLATSTTLTVQPTRLLGLVRHEILQPCNQRGYMDSLRFDSSF